MAHERVEEARDVVKHIKDTHLMTWTNEEWDAWVREHAGGRRDDALYLLGKIREAWGRDWPMVDFDGFMESYRMFGRDGVGGLRALLTPSRNRKGERLMENGGDNGVLRAVMRVVMRIGDEGDLDVLRRERVVGKGWVPGGEGGVTLEELDGVPEAGGILMFFMSSYREGDFRPVLLQYDETRGDGGDSRGWLDAGFIDRVHKVLSGLHGGEGVLREPPVMGELYTELWQKAYSGGRLVRMDLANFICGSLGNISALCNSGVMREANREVGERLVALGLEGVGEWRDNLGRSWEVEEGDGVLRMVRYVKERDRDGRGVERKRTFFMQLFRDFGGLRGYVYTYDEAERLFNGEDAGDVCVFVSVRLSDADGHAMVDRVEGGKVSVMEFEFVNKDRRRGDLLFTAKSLTFVRGVEGFRRRCGYESEVEERNEGLMRERYLMRNGDYGYLACEMRDCGRRGVEVVSWLRVPLWGSFVDLSGEGSGMCDLSSGEGVTLRRLRSKAMGGEWRYVLHFVQRGVMVDVTDVLRPREGVVMPYGIVLVREPRGRFLSSGDVWVRVVGARVARGECGGLVMRVDYGWVDYGVRARDKDGELTGEFASGVWSEDEELVVYGGE